MRYLITGGLGFIGSHLAEEIASRNHEIVIVDDGRTSVVSDLDGMEIIRQPIANADPQGHFDGIFHLAGPVGPVGVLDHAGLIVPSVVSDAQTVAWWALDSDCPLVYVSTSEIYGEQEQPVSEAKPRIIAPGSSARMEYAVAKLAAETMLLNMSSLDVTIVRPFNVAGPRQSDKGGFVLPRFIRQALAGEPLTVYQPGTQMRAFTHVYDIVDGIWAAMRQGHRRVAYNLGNPDNACPILDLAQEVVRLTDSHSRIEVIDPVELWGTSFREAPDKIPDISLAREYLNFAPYYETDSIIRHMIEEIKLR